MTRALSPLRRPAGHERLSGLNRELEGLQELLYAENKRKVLIVLQAMDTGGKDGTIPSRLRRGQPTRGASRQFQEANAGGTGP